MNKLDPTLLVQKGRYELYSEDKDIVLVGAGSLCQKFLENESSLKEKIKLIFDSDLNKKDTKINGFKISHILDLERLKNKKKYIFIITSSFIKEIAKTLLNCNISCFYSYIYILSFDKWKIKDEDQKYINQVNNILSDEKSIDILNKIVNYRNIGKADFSDVHSKEQYFFDKFKYTDKEVFLDGGAYDGREIHKFIDITKGNFLKVYSFELSPINYQAVKKNIVNSEKVHTYNLGLWNKEAYLEVKENGPGARVNISNENTEDKEPNLIAIDEFFNDKETPTFIKMDIEGAELEALKGAKNTIVKNKPKLAICLYHKPDDLWKIPLYLKDLVPEYKFYIRHHSKVRWETILYATV